MTYNQSNNGDNLSDEICPVCFGPLDDDDLTGEIEEIKSAIFGTYLKFQYFCLGCDDTVWIAQND